ncbi:MAG TPA: DUF2117 domain-containing protein [Methanothrix sp.]|nr:DUF2117 domain-containing protein [Methanothrix sp.]
MRTSRPAARIGVVVHGPEIVDSGSALKLIGYLKKFGEVAAVLGGTMGRLAVIDAGLEDLIAISSRRRPSEALRSLGSASDQLIILTQSKARETGLVFGSKVAAAAMTAKPLIQIDCAGRFVAELVGETGDFSSEVSSDLGFDLLTPPKITGPFRDKGMVRRTLTGVLPGEQISINGTVVARATDSSVEIVASGGRIIDIKGAEPKIHGLEKLSSVDLERAIIRSGEIRRTSSRPRLKECHGEGAVLIDHSAEDAFEIAKGASTAVTIGDDTTAIAADILARLGIKVIGIVDGDLDGLASRTAIPKGSVILTVEPGNDDLLGRRVKKELFENNSRADLEAGYLVKRVMEMAGDLIVRVEMY